MSERMTDQEMRELANELRTSVQLSKNLFNVLNNILTGGVDDAFELNGVMVPSLSARIKSVIDQAVEDGVIEMPEGKAISDIYVNEQGKMVVVYSDGTTSESEDTP